MHCPHCGQIIDDHALYCTYCGNSVIAPEPPVAPKSRSHFGYGVLGFFIPLVGLILFLVYNKDKQKQGKAAGIGALIGYSSKFVAGSLLMVGYIFIYLFIIMIAILGGMTEDSPDVQLQQDGSYVSSVAEVTIGEFRVTDARYEHASCLEVLVENTSDESYTFYVTIEAVDEYGTRVGIEDLQIYALEPGQTAKVYAFEDISYYQIFDLEDATFRVLEIQSAYY